MNEQELMKAAEQLKTPTPEALAATPSPVASGDDGLLTKIKAATQARADVPAKPKILEAPPAPARAPLAIRWRSPETGKECSCEVEARVLLETKDRMLVFQTATLLVGEVWEFSAPRARQDAVAEATCRVQWDADATAPEWLKVAYRTDPDFALALSMEVDALTQRYFRGHNPEGGEDTTERFLVECKAVSPPSPRV